MSDNERTLEAEELEAIEKRAENATTGPWTVHYEDEDIATVNQNCWSTAADGTRHHYYGDEVVRASHRDAEFIAAAREDIPALLADRVRLVERCEMLESTLRIVLAGFTEKGSLGGIDNCLRAGWVDRDRVERWRAVLGGEGTEQ